MTETYLLAVMAFAAGFGLAWTMRAALARLDLRDKQDVIDVLAMKLEDQSREMVELLQDYHDSLSRSPWTNNAESYRQSVELKQAVAKAQIIDLVPAGEKS